MAKHFGGNLTCGGAAGRCPRCRAAKNPPQEPPTRVLGEFWNTPTQPRTTQNACTENWRRPMGVFDSGEKKP